MDVDRDCSVRSRDSPRCCYPLERDERAKRWISEVRKVDRFFFLKSKHGAVVGVFMLVGPKNGARLRKVAQAALQVQRSIRHWVTRS